MTAQVNKILTTNRGEIAPWKSIPLNQSQDSLNGPGIEHSKYDEVTEIGFLPDSGYLTGTIHLPVRTIKYLTRIQTKKNWRLYLMRIFLRTEQNQGSD